MLVYISLTLLILSILIIFKIISKKFTTLALLDLDYLPGRKEAKFKNQIITKRLDRDIDKVEGFFGKFKEFFNHRFGTFLQQFHLRLERSKEQYQKQKKLTLNERQEKISSWFSEAKEAIKKDDLDKAEELLISIINLNNRYLPAFIELGDVYFESRKYLEAKQTFVHVLKVLSKKTINDFSDYRSKKELFFSLANVNKYLNNLDEAIDNLQDALDLERNNPRYLDLILELSILNKDYAVAENSLRRLEESNPENKKISEFRSRLNNIY